MDLNARSEQGLQCWCICTDHLYIDSPGKRAIVGCGPPPFEAYSSAFTAAFYFSDDVLFVGFSVQFKGC